MVFFVGLSFVLCVVFLSFLRGALRGFLVCISCFLRCFSSGVIGGVVLVLFLGFVVF